MWAVPIMYMMSSSCMKLGKNLKVCVNHSLFPFSLYINQSSTLNVTVLFFTSFYWMDSFGLRTCQVWDRTSASIPRNKWGRYYPAFACGQTDKRAGKPVSAGGSRTRVHTQCLSKVRDVSYWHEGRVFFFLPRYWKWPLDSVDFINLCFLFTSVIIHQFRCLRRWNIFSFCAVTVLITWFWNKVIDIVTSNYKVYSLSLYCLLCS